MAVSLATLLVQETKDNIYTFALGVANAIGLPVSTWQAGDPTRAQFHIESELLASLESVVAGFIGSGFLDYATGEWLKILAEQQFNFTVPEASLATTDVVLTNAGGGVYDLEAGDLTLKNTTTGKTYHNTTGGHLSALSTLTITVVADEPGSDSSAGAGEIDDLVTTLLGVTCTNADAAVGVDEQDESTTRQQCRDKASSFSPDGPATAYRYTALNSDLTGTTGITRARVYGDSSLGTVTIYLAGPSGGVSGADRALAEAAILEWATPVCITPSVLAATNVSKAVTYQLWVYESVNKTTAEIAAAVQTALEDLFARQEIGGDIVPPSLTGKLYRSLIDSTILGVFPQAFRVSVSLPAADTSLANSEVATLGTVTPTITLVPDP